MLTSAFNPYTYSSTSTTTSTSPPPHSPPRPNHEWPSPSSNLKPTLKKWSHIFVVYFRIKLSFRYVVHIITLYNRTGGIEIISLHLRDDRWGIFNKTHLGLVMVTILFLFFLSLDSPEIYTWRFPGAFFLLVVRDCKQTSNKNLFFLNNNSSFFRLVWIFAYM